MTLALRYAVRSDVGLLREGNEDSAYAGPRLLAVADGMGGHAAGEVASAVAISSLADLDEDVPGNNLLDVLADAVTRANHTLHDMVLADPAVEGMGTTLTAMLWSGPRVAVVHIGDSRAYVLRDGELFQITRDHTLVQSLVDEGRISPDEAATHPQRSLLLRALDGRSDAEPDLSLREVRLGDRYLLCSDGLSGVVSEETLRDTLAGIADLDSVVLQLIELAIKGGGPDNITCIVADVVDSATGALPPSEVSVLAGAASHGSSGPLMRTDSPAGRAHVLTRPATQALTVTHDDPAPARPAAAEDEDEEDGHVRRRWPIVTSALAVLLIVIVGAGYAAWRYSQSQYYVGSQNGKVVIFRGINESVAGLSLSSVVQQTGIPVAQVPAATDQVQINATIAASGLSDAQRIVSRIRNDYLQCKQAYANQAAYAAALSTYQQALAAYKKLHHTTKKITIRGKTFTPPTPPAQPTPVPASCPAAAAPAAASGSGP